MKYTNKKLKIEKVSVKYLAKRYGTPAYCYSFKQLKENIYNFKKNFLALSKNIFSWTFLMALA